MGLPDVKQAVSDYCRADFLCAFDQFSNSHSLKKNIYNTKTMSH